jgi:hypothetical protein
MWDVEGFIKMPSKFKRVCVGFTSHVMMSRKTPTSPLIEVNMIRRTTEIYFPRFKSARYACRWTEFQF